MNTLRRLTTLATTLAVVTLAGCAANTTPVPPCCYQGEVTTARFEALELTREDGKRMKLLDAMPGFKPQVGLFAAALPFDQVERADMYFASLQPLLDIYDSNHDGMLERPEVIVLYAREALLATGTAVRHIGGDTSIGALSAPNADVGGLVKWAESRRKTMNSKGQQVFSDLERLGLDLRHRGGEEANNDIIIKP
jgi:hypothetical protein